VSPGSSGVSQQLKGWVWQHREKEGGDKIISLSFDFLAIEYNQSEFKHFPEFNENFKSIYSAFQELYKVKEFPRIGLRYINEIDIPEGNPLDWDSLISESLVSSVKAGYVDGMKLSISMHQLHTIKNDISVLFQYGIFNPDYPNPVARKQFILDYDCYIPSPTADSEVLECVKQLNSVAEEMFEQSIENGLRDRMEVIDG
jgi:uncharacterized protein (TIGR04255 family)